MTEFLSLLYAGVGVVALIGYLPQIYTLVKATGQSKAISLSSWSLWTGTSSVSMLYGMFVNGDALIIFSGAVNFVGCALILSIASYNRYYRFKDEEIVVVHKPKAQHLEQSQPQNQDEAEQLLTA